MKFIPATKTVKTVIGVFAIVFVAALPVVTNAAYKTENVGTAGALYQDFVIGPGKVELEIKPGESRTTSVMVTNRLGSTKTFTLEVEDFTGSRNPAETVVLLGDERGPYSLKDFIHFETKTFELRNGERAVIPVTVSIPTDAEPGGRYGSLLAGVTSSEVSAAQKSAVVSRLGVLFFVKIPGEAKKEGVLKGLNTANDQKIFGSSPITFRLLYENNGSVYLNPYGEIRIKNIIGEEVGAVEVDPWFSLPQSLRLREVSWDRSFLFGRYTAVASINRGYDDIIDTTSVSFWVIPWKIVLGVFAAVLIIVFALRLILSKFEIKRKS